MAIRAQKWRATFGYYGLFICLGLGMAIFGPTIPDIAAQVGTPAEVLGVLGLIGSIGYTVGTFVGGRLFDRVVRGHALLGAAELAAAGLLAAYPLASAFWMLVVIVLLRGLLEGMVNTGANTLLVWTHGERASPFMNGLHFCFGIGASLSPFLVGKLISWGAGYRAAFWVVAAVAALIGLWVMVSDGSPDPRAHVARAASGSSGASVIRWAPVVLAALYLFAYVGGEIAFGMWVSTYALWLQIADKAGAAYLASVFWFAFTIGRLISIPAAIRFTPRQVIPVALVPCLLISGAMMVVPPSDYRTLLVAAAALGFCLAPLWPSGYTLAGQVIPLTAFASGLVLLGDSLGGAVLPSSAGWIMTRMQGAGPQLLPLSLPLLVFASLVLVLLAYVGLIAVAGREPRGARTT